MTPEVTNARAYGARPQLRLRTPLPCDDTTRHRLTAGLGPSLKLTLPAAVSVGEMDRRTKIVATVGPASEELHTIRAMIAAGMNMARLSLSHGALADTVARIARVREAAERDGSVVGVLADLPGPKIRAAEFPDGGVHLAEGTTIELVQAAPGDASSERRIAVEPPSVIADLQP